MIPLRDTVPTVHRPVGMWIIILLNVAAFFFELGLPEQMKLTLFHFFGVVPARYFHPDWAAWAGYPSERILPLFTYMFLHSGWLHIILNMWMLYIFADNIEDVMGTPRFLLFYLACGVASIAVHLAFNHSSPVPVVGASGAVAGVMGAYFLLYPHAKVVTFVPLFFVIPYVVLLPAPLFLGLWAVIQIASGVYEHVSGIEQNIAWWAHIGGFASGMILVNLFKVPRRCYYCYNPAHRNYERRNGR